MTLLSAPTRRTAASVPTSVAPNPRLGAATALTLIVAGALQRAWLAGETIDGEVTLAPWTGEAAALAAVLVIGYLLAPLAARIAMSPRGRAVLMGGALLILAAPLTPFGAVAANGARVGVASPIGPVQPVHLAILAVVMLVAGYLATIGDGASTNAPLVGPVLVTTGAAAALLTANKDLGPGVVLTAAIVLTAASSTKRLRPLIALVAAKAIGAVAAGAASDVARNRVTSWLEGTNEQVARALAAASNSSWTGAGTATRPRGVPLVGEDLPLIATAHLGGAVAVTLWLVTFAAVIFVSARTARAAGPAGAALGSACTALLGAHLIVATAMTFGVMPHSGVTTPWLSTGMSSLVAVSLTAGLALGAARAAVDRHRVTVGGLSRKLDAGVAGLLTVLLVAGLIVRAGQIADGIGVDLTWLPMVATTARGPIVDARGQVLVAESAAGQPRVPLPDSLAVVGTADPSTFARGVEAFAADTLTCGGSGRIERLLGRCAPATVTLTLNGVLQQRTAAHLRGVAADTGTTASFLAVDTEGRILAAASSDDAPNPAALALGGSHESWVAGVFHDTAPPGSIVKVAVAAAAADAGVLRSSVPHLTHVALSDGSRIGAWQPAGCGGTTAGWAILVHSCNPATVVTTRDVGHDRVSQVLQQAGVGVERIWPGVPHATSFHGLGGDAPAAERAAIGEGNARWTLADAVFLPLLVSGHGTVPEALSVLTDQPPGRVDIVSAEAAAEVAALMRACVADTSGTCRGAFDAARATVAAKTGTAQRNATRGSVGWCIGTAQLDGRTVAFAARLLPRSTNVDASGNMACKAAAPLLDGALAAVG